MILFLHYNCGENLIEEVKERYSGGELKVVEYYKKVGDNQELVRKREYYQNGQLQQEINYKLGYYEAVNHWLEKYNDYFTHVTLREIK